MRRTLIEIYCIGGGGTQSNLISKCSPLFFEFDLLHRAPPAAIYMHFFLFSIEKSIGPNPEKSGSGFHFSIN
jgi:hypothetical protein